MSIDAIMFAAIFLIAAPSAPDLSGIALEDAFRFGVPKEVCRQLYQFGYAQSRELALLVRLNNPPEVCDEWAREVAWRTRCWYVFDDAFICEHLTIGKRLYALAELRRLIGDEAYYSGRLPFPTPNYRVGGR